MLKFKSKFLTILVNALLAIWILPQWITGLIGWLIFRNGKLYYNEESIHWNARGMSVDGMHSQAAERGTSHSRIVYLHGRAVSERDLAGYVQDLLPGLLWTGASCA